jgi:hypothetical protein
MRAWIAGALAAAMLSAAAAPRDQGLPASLEHANAATELAATLRTEIEAAGAGADGTARASAAVRRIAFDLLFRGSSARADGQASAVAGFRLAWLRADIDRALRGTPRDAEARGRLDAAIAAFVTAAEHGIERMPPADRPEDALRALLLPLEVAIEAAAPTESAAKDPGTSWPAPDAPREPADARLEAWLVPAQAAPAPTDDAARVARVAGWVDLVRACNARAGSTFEVSAGAWSAALRERARQQAARASMDSFASEEPLARPGAFERAVRAGDPEARAACAGRPDDLVRSLDGLRAAWALGWANGRGSPDATAALRRAVRVTEALAASAACAVPDTAAGEVPLSAWGGTAVAPDGRRIHPKALAARAALALEAVLDGKADAAERELAALARDVPIARLEAAARSALGSWLAGRDTLRARLRAVSDAPAEGAFLGAARADLMLMSRLLVEESRARAVRDQALADELRARAAAAAARALGAARLPG